MAGDEKHATADELRKALGLRPLPLEGGLYRETYRAAESIAATALPSRYRGARSHATAIYFMLTPGEFSAMHRVLSDEVFHFYGGDPVEQLRLFPDGRGELVPIGADVLGGMKPQVVVPHGVWQGARLRKGGEHALLGCTVSPGFEFADLEMGERAALVSEYPEFRELIEALTYQ